MRLIDAMTPREALLTGFVCGITFVLLFYFAL